MKAKKRSLKSFKPVSAAAAVFALAASGAHAQTPVFNYSFTNSWSGTGTTVLDQSSADNNGKTVGSLALAASVPSGAAIGTQSVTGGGILTTASSLLNNSTIAAAGGFNYSVAFNWNGTDSSSFGHTEKIIDYAGAESLQLVTTSGSASLQMVFGPNGPGPSVSAVSTTILPNTWYTVSLTFLTGVNTVDVNGGLAGNVDMNVNGTDYLGSAYKGNYGDSLGRPIGVGQLGANFGYLVGFNGDIYNPSVTLVPEPSSLALGLLGGFGVLGTVWNARRRKA